MALPRALQRTSAEVGCSSARPCPLLLRPPTSARRLLLAAASLLALALSVARPTAVLAQETIEKTVCLSTFGYSSVDSFRSELLTLAKRSLAEELFGEIVVGKSESQDGVIISDEVRTLVLGLIHTTGSPEYSNGSAVGEGCVTLSGYVTSADVARFEPVVLRRTECVADPDLSVRALRTLAEEGALLKAIRDYDRRLEVYSDSEVSHLARRVLRLDSGFIAGTETYCATQEAQVIPIEVDALLLTDPLPPEGPPFAPDAPSPTPVAGLEVEPSDMFAEDSPASPTAIAPTTPAPDPTLVPATVSEERQPAPLSPTPTPRPAIAPTFTHTPRPAAAALPATPTPEVVAPVSSVVARPEVAAISNPAAAEALLPPPILLAPPSGETFDPYATVPLAWRPVKQPLAADELYLVTIRFEHGGVPWVDYAWTRTGSWSLGQHRYLLEIATTDRYEWSVKLVRQVSADGRGVPTGLDLSAPSESRVIYWRKELELRPTASPTPSSTPTPQLPPDDIDLRTPTETPDLLPTDTPEPPAELPTETPESPVEPPTNTPEPPAELPTETPESPVEPPTDTPEPPAELPTDTPEPPAELTPEPPPEEPTDTPEPPPEEPTEEPPPA